MLIPRHTILFILALWPAIFGLTAPEIFAQDWLVVFAANLETTGGVHREDPSGANLYSVRFNPTTKIVSELTRLTHDEDAAEWFPSLSSDTQWIAYNYQKQGKNEVRLLNRLTGAETTIFKDGRFPEWVGNSSLLISYSNRSLQDIYLVTLDFSGTAPRVLSRQRLTNRIRCPDTSMAQDAYPFPDGNQMAFHILRAGNLSGAAMAIMNMDGTNFRRLTDWNGSGHGIVNSTGQEMVYGSSQTGIPEALRVNETNSVPMVLPLPSNANSGIPYDSRFGQVAKIHWSYPAWVNDDHSLFLSAQGSSESNVFSFSRLLYVSCNDQWENPQIFDFSSAVEVLAGKSGRDFCTASSR